MSPLKRALRSHLRRRRIQPPTTAAGESPEEWTPSDDWRPPLAVERVPFWSDPSIRWTVEEMDSGKRKVGTVFDQESNSWVVKYRLPLPACSSGAFREIKCGVCDKPGHLDLGCSLMFEYPPDSPPFNTEHFEVVCECGSNEIVPGRRSCINCQPNSRLRVDSKYPPPLIEYQNEDPDLDSYSPIFPDMWD